MNWTLLNVISDIYTVALLRNVKQEKAVKQLESRFGKLVKLFYHG